MAWGEQYLLPLPDSDVVPEALEESLGLGALRMGREGKGRASAVVTTVSSICASDVVDIGDCWGCWGIRPCRTRAKGGGWSA